MLIILHERAVDPAQSAGWRVLPGLPVPGGEGCLRAVRQTGYSRFNPRAPPSGKDWLSRTFQGNDAMRLLAAIDSIVRLLEARTPTSPRTRCGSAVTRSCWPEPWTCPFCSEND